MPRKSERDEVGYRIPVEGSRARRIYDLMKAGRSQTEITTVLFPNGDEDDYQRVGVALYQIRHPDRTNGFVQRMRAKNKAGRIPYAGAA